MLGLSGFLRITLQILLPFKKAKQLQNKQNQTCPTNSLTATKRNLHSFLRKQTKLKFFIQSFVFKYHLFVNSPPIPDTVSVKNQPHIQKSAPISISFSSHSIILQQYSLLLCLPFYLNVGEAERKKEKDLKPKVI